ncbi:MAG: hypothetical protein M5U31_15525 [Acidimicrobiia bacterium]|nr:hypothetical protein [Acidimicrobiia bacterium]
MKDEPGVGGHDERIELEDEECGVGLSGKLALFDGVVGGGREKVDPLLLVVRHASSDRPRPSAELGRRCGEEAATGQSSVLDVIEKGVAQGTEALLAFLGECRCDDHVDEQPARRVDRGELELLLGTEVGIESALAHAGGGSQVADAQAVEPLDGGQPDRGVEDLAAGAFTVGPGSAFGNHGSGHHA